MQVHMERTKVPVANDRVLEKMLKIASTELSAESRNRQSILKSYTVAIPLTDIGVQILCSNHR